MKNSIKIEEMKEFIEKKVHKHFDSFNNDKDIQLIQSLLQNQIEKEHEDFTFTIGDINAYMG